MSTSRRRQLAVVASLMLLSALVEVISIGAVIPFLSILASPSTALQFPYFGEVFSRLGAQSHQHQILAAASFFICAIVAAMVVRLCLAWTSQSLVLRLGHELSVDIQRRILSQPYSYHIAHSSSEAIAALEKVQVLVYGVLLQVAQSAAAALIALFILGAVLQLDPVAAAIAAGALVAIYGFVSLMAKARLAEISGILSSAYERRVQIVQESLGGIRDIILDRSGDLHVEEFRKVDLQLTVASAWSRFIGVAPRLFAETLGIVAISALTVTLMRDRGGVAAALPLLGAIALGAQRLLPLVQQLYSGWALFSANRSVLSDVSRLLSLPTDDDPAGRSQGPVMPLRGDIRLDQVSFFHPTRTAPAIDSVSLTIPKGSFFAITGPTGSGKSTLADLLMGLLTPTEGTIRVGDVALGKNMREVWQASISHVPQSIFLSDASLLQNIAFGVDPQNIDMDRLELAVRMAQLDEFVGSLPEGLSTIVGERGARLSGGQRQRIGMARALYKNWHVMVLDEATNALDEANEAAILSGLHDEVQRGKTVVMISHRRSAIAFCDRVIELKDGLLVRDSGRQVSPTKRAKIPI